MNTNSNSNVIISFSGQLTISRDVLIELLHECVPCERTVAESKPFHVLPPVTVCADGNPGRLAFSMRETADLLGVSYITVHRLLQRGLLRSSVALRNKIIAKAEIERFLRETSERV